MPRLRFTVRRMMLAVAALAIGLGGWRFAREWWENRADYPLLARHFRYCEASSRTAASIPDAAYGTGGRRPRRGGEPGRTSRSSARWGPTSRTPSSSDSASTPARRTGRVVTRRGVRAPRRPFAGKDPQEAGGPAISA